MSDRHRDNLPRIALGAGIAIVVTLTSLVTRAAWQYLTL